MAAQDDGTGGVTFDEIEEQLKTAESKLPDLSKITLGDESVPERLRGKTVADMVNHMKELENALKMSEQSRQEALILAKTASERPAQSVQAPAQPEPEPLVTAEEVAEAFQEDSAKGVALMQKMNEQAIARAAQHFSQRLEPLISGSASTVETQARQKYPDEFELYKDEIDALVKQLPNKNVLSTSQSWDDMIAYVRGKNPTKLFEHMAAKEAKKREDAARESERSSVGFQSMGTQRTPAPSSGPVLDATVDEVCRVLGITKDEYAKWNGVQ